MSSAHVNKLLFVVYLLIVNLSLATHIDRALLENLEWVQGKKFFLSYTYYFSIYGVKEKA